MGQSYTAVGWNRQKKIYDWLLVSFCVTYLSVFVVVSSLFNGDFTAETLLIRSTSTLALLLLQIILSIGPLCRINKKFLPLLYNRRHLGVTMFSVALVHGVFAILQFHSLGNVNPMISLFSSNTQYGSLTNFPFQALGFFALLILWTMASTSHDFWLKALSPRIWKLLHMMVYFAYFLIIMHVMLGVIQFETNPVFVVILMIGALSLITLHVFAALKEAKKDNVVFDLKKDGFVMVCNLNDIEENRAKMFCVDKERIAVFRMAGELFAISNVCKHQNGPLGEGKIIDGCVTCPWHGYQYFPHNGQSPPPFKEKVSTYQVKLEGNLVWVNPIPFPEGTGQKGAQIEKIS